jgi:hypothetical protein
VGHHRTREKKPCESYDKSMKVIGSDIIAARETCVDPSLHAK